MGADQQPSATPVQPRGAVRRQAQAGFTLVEMLVSLVILGFVMSLVSEAIFQVAQVTRAADATTRSLSARWGAGWTAGSLFANLLAPQLDGTAPVLRGSTRRVEGYTSLPLDGGDTGITPFGLSLEPAASGGATTELRWTPPQELGREAAAPSVVAAFPGRAEFAYIGRNDQTVDNWPPLTRAGLEPEDLPKAVLVRDAGTGSILMWYGFPGETVREQLPNSPFGELAR